jgi:hypothetical protein
MAMILLSQEVVGFALVYGAALVMSRVERRSAGAYGLPMSEALGSKFWLGFLFGLLEVSLLIGLIAAFGGYSFGSLALHGREIVQWGLFHLLLFFFVGLFEEFLFRGYMQYTLADGIGFLARRDFAFRVVWRAAPRQPRRRLGGSRRCGSGGDFLLLHTEANGEPLVRSGLAREL